MRHRLPHIQLLASLLALSGLGLTALAQTQTATGTLKADVKTDAPGARRVITPGPPVFYTVPMGETDATIRETGEAMRLPLRMEWKFACGTPTVGRTPEDLARIAAEHERQFQDRSTVRIIDTPPPGGPYAPRTNVNLVYSLSGSVPAGAAAAFTLAEQYIESKWSDPITVNINVSWANLGGGVIGATGSAYTTPSYSICRTWIVNGRDANDTIQSSLPTGTTLPVRFTGSSATVTNVSSIAVTTANYRAAIGAVTANPDANMQYNSTFGFDFNPADGVPGSLLSLVDTIVHETCHAMGFTSGADSGNQQTNMLDLYRFARTAGVWNPTTLAEFGTVARVVDNNDPTGEDVNSDIITAEYRMSDGNPYQASHFYSQSFDPAFAIGIMQPAIANGVTFYPNHMRAADLAMMDAIGWDDAGACASPSITAHPPNRTVCAGVATSLSITASGTGITYQWRRNDVNISGATAALYSLPSPTPANSGTYTCVVTGTCGTATSNPATVTVNSGAAITAQPAPTTTVTAGQPASFSVTATGSPLPTFQWRKGAVNISGATGSTFSIPATTIADSGSYDCIVTNICGSATSSTAVLTVNAGCVADYDDGSGTGIRDGGVTLDDLLYYLGLFGDGNVAADVDDGSGNNVHDGGVTIEDLLYYLIRFDAGC